MMKRLHSVRAFAPATCANLAVGFDILGLAVEGLGDEVTLIKRPEKSLNIVSVSGPEHIPHEIEKNTATVALKAMLDYLNIKQGFNVIIKKHIPLSSGLGGSAASSVAAVVALNGFLKQPLSNEQLVPFCLLGEHAASGVKHGDNVLPSLYGGLNLIQSLEPLVTVQLPIPQLHLILVHPHLHLNTREARMVLDTDLNIDMFTKQNARMAAFISALYQEDYQLMESVWVDELIEPMRAHLIPFFYEVKSTAYQYGAVVCSISGSGPTLFAFAKTRAMALQIAKKMSWKFKVNGIQNDTMVTFISKQGARVMDE